MSHDYETGAKFLSSLTEIDVACAQRVRAAGCQWCGGVLDRADYPRKPRGDLGEAVGHYERSLSLCCRRDGCRRRATPPSVRYLGRKVYVAAWIVVATAMARSTKIVRRDPRLFGGAPARTVGRWLSWWSLVLARSAFWVEARGHFSMPVDVDQLPCSLIDCFGQGSQLPIERVLRFVSPVTTTSVRMSISMVA